MTWYYDNVPYEYDGTSFGFVYLIENLITGRKYIGRKYFTQAGTRQVNGKKKKDTKAFRLANVLGFQRHTQKRSCSSRRKQLPQSNPAFV